MKIHEYQAKELFRAYDIPTPKGFVVDATSDISEIAKKVSSSCWVIKAQVHAGGRGKGGGVQIARNLPAIKEHVSNLLGSYLVTPQTDAKGSKVNSLLIEAGCDIATEHYVSLLIDRVTQHPVFVVSKEGGGDIEETALKNPASIYREVIDPMLGLQPFQARRLTYALGVHSHQMKATMHILQQVYKLFMEKDCSLIEINPLVVTKDGQVVALDGKIIFDENALFRHQDICKLHDPEEEDARELAAKQQDLNYVALEGEIGCMVNGAGLAMATMDILNYFGGRPANFLDVGGGATIERVEAAFKILMDDDQVKAVFINIFGGIVCCDILAKGIVSAVANVKRVCPLIVRLEGTRVKEGLAILNDSDLPITTAMSMDEGAELAVLAAKQAKKA